MQTILGSGGAIGIELAKALPQFTNHIRLVSRTPQAVNTTDELFPADLMQTADVFEAVAGSDVVYLTVGLPYSTKTWQNDWPVVMQNVIDACQAHQARLVFFDNVYMYDPDYLGMMNEETPTRPVSKKGMVRSQVADMLLDAVNNGDLQALIARSADFYGPSIKNNSVLTETVFNSLAQGKRANWLSSINYQHSFTYVPDAAKATALLGNTDTAYGQVWHLPTARNPLTGKEWIETVAQEMGAEAQYQVAPKFLIKVMGWFNPMMRETPEMMYQYDRDYVFDSSKFVDNFDFEPTPYLEGIIKIIATDYKTQPEATI
ncbi:MAG: NAD-dependent epimerase/dehydratase family protein [Chloroflexota bacterium]